MYDYIAFGWLFGLLLMMILTALLSANKKPKLASFLIFTSFILMFTAPIGIKIFLDKTVRKVEILDQNSTKLNFSKALVITGKIKNQGKIDLHKCYINAKVLKTSNNKYLDFLYNLKPIRKRTILTEANLSKEKFEEFKVVFEKFNYKKEYRVSLSAECY
jgi:aromatic ring-opening dioxygenase LigB subunit